MENDHTSTTAPHVLVTGAARGIGKAMVDDLAAAGWNVIAGVRNERDAEAITQAHPDRITAITLDVANDEHIADLPDQLPPRLDAVVNNAGIVVGGPVESITPEQWRRQLEVNLIGQLAVTQAVLPRLRESRGRIVFISSINGQLSTPLSGAYSASKFALEAAADALRMELKPWHIPVVVVEPGPTDTGITNSMIADAEAIMSPEQRSLYATHITGIHKAVGSLQRMAVPPEEVAAVVKRALTTRRPRARYVVGLGPTLQVAIAKSLPTSVRDRVLRLTSHQP